MVEKEINEFIIKTISNFNSEIKERREDMENVLFIYYYRLRILSNKKKLNIIKKLKNIIISIKL